MILKGLGHGLHTGPGERQVHKFLIAPPETGQDSDHGRLAKWTVLCCAKSLQSCPTLCDPMDCSPPGSSVHGIFQARILEWVAMLSSRRSPRPRDRTCVSDVSCIAGSLPLAPLGNPAK